MKSGASHQPPAAKTTPITAPAAVPHCRLRRMRARTYPTSPAPSACPTRACAAMARASRAKAARPHIALTT
nr:hypothetical protein DA06_06840 [Georgenia sp. SUBG003]